LAGSRWSLNRAQWQNAAARSAVWVVFFLLWLHLQKPTGASLAAVRRDALGAAGALLVLMGIAGLLWSVMTLARAIAGDARLTGAVIEGGPYHYSRNPLYLSAAAVCAGIYLLYAPFRFGDIGIAVVLVVLVQWAVVRLEEPATSRRLGSAFEDYKRRVPRWLAGPRSH
jgi:protein-S-isoprenylcysteine O-methyltransferase Ste14